MQQRRDPGLQEVAQRDQGGRFDMKVWEKPQLVVLTRSRPEEAVLGWCKQYHVGSGPGTAFLGFACDSVSYPCYFDCEFYVFS